MGRPTMAIYATKPVCSSCKLFAVQEWVHVGYFVALALAVVMRLAGKRRRIRPGGRAGQDGDWQDTPRNSVKLADKLPLSR